jgi:hypothetical protein
MKSLAELAVMVGKWRMTGRSVGLDHDNIEGEIAIRWLAEPQVLALVGSISFDGESIESVEIVWFDPDSQRGLAHAYGAGQPLDYWWDINGSTLRHGDNGSTYTGTISEDGSTITGGWRAEPGTEPTPQTDYGVVMRRIGEPDAGSRGG